MSSELITQLRIYAACVSTGSYIPATVLRAAADEIQRLNAECDRLAQRNTMLVNELSDRGRQFTPREQRRMDAIAAMAKDLYKGEG